MRTYLTAAIAYVQENGDELERARLAGLLGRSRAEPKVARSLLARLLGSRHDAVMRAAICLRASRDGGWPAEEPAHVTAQVAAALLMVDGPSSAATSAGLDALRRLSPEVWTADRLADSLNALYLAGLPADDLFVAAGLARLLALQRIDGGWSSDDGADRDVDLSLRATGVLLAYGVATLLR